MKKLLFAGLLCSLTLMPWAVMPAAAETSEIPVIEREALDPTAAGTSSTFWDEGEILSETEFEEIGDLLYNASVEINMNVGVWFGSTPMDEYDTKVAVRNKYLEDFGADSDGIYLYIDMSGEDDLYDYIATKGWGEFYYTNSPHNDRVTRMLEDITPYLSRGAEEPVKAVEKFCEDLVKYYEAGVPSGYVVMNDDNGRYMYVSGDKIVSVAQLPEDMQDSVYAYNTRKPWGAVFAAGVFFALIAALIAWAALKSKYRFKAAQDVNVYLEKGSVKFVKRSDRYIRTYTNKTRIDTDSDRSSGGSSSFGGGHSSGGFGGGGHHR